MILDVVYNHTGEGNQLGPTLSFRGHRQALVLPARGRCRASISTSPGPGTGSTPASERPANGHGRLRYWVNECTWTASVSTSPPRSPASLRLRPAIGILRPHPPGSGVLPGQARRRALGRRPRRLSRRRVPGPAGRVERPFRDTVRDFWRGADERRRPPTRFTGSSDLYGMGTAAPRPRPSTSSPPTTASRLPSRLVRQEAQRGEPARTTTTATTTTAPGTAASRGRRKTPRSARCARVNAQLLAYGAALRRGCRCWSAGDELDEPSWQQQRVVPGQ